MDFAKRNESSTVLIVILILAFLLGYWLYSTHTSLPNLTTISAGSSNNSYTVTTNNQPLTAAQINTVLCTNHSPACGTGQALYQDAMSAQIDDSYALAVFHAESSYGIAGIAKTTRSLGNIMCSSGYTCYSGYRSYASWEAGYADWFSLIKNLYINTKKLTTVATIAEVYAPPTDNNTSQYVANIETTMDSLSK